jgi:hypothetical protein
MTVAALQMLQHCRSIFYIFCCRSARFAWKSFPRREIRRYFIYLQEQPECLTVPIMLHLCCSKARSMKSPTQRKKGARAYAWTPPQN